MESKNIYFFVNWSPQKFRGTLSLRPTDSGRLILESQSCPFVRLFGVFRKIRLIFIIDNTHNMNWIFRKKTVLRKVSESTSKIKVKHRFCSFLISKCETTQANRDETANRRNVRNRKTASKFWETEKSPRTVKP